MKEPKRCAAVQKAAIDCISKNDLVRLARRAGSKRVAGGLVDKEGAVRAALVGFLQSLVKDAALFAEHGRRRTVTLADMHMALKKNGRPLYGYGPDWCQRAQRFSSAVQRVRLTQEQLSVARRARSERLAAVGEEQGEVEQEQVGPAAAEPACGAAGVAAAPAAVAEKVPGKGAGEGGEGASPSSAAGAAPAASPAPQSAPPPAFAIFTPELPPALPAARREGEGEAGAAGAMAAAAAAAIEEIAATGSVGRAEEEVELAVGMPEAPAAELGRSAAAASGAEEWRGGTREEAAGETGAEAAAVAPEAAPLDAQRADQIKGWLSGAMTSLMRATMSGGTLSRGLVVQRVIADHGPGYAEVQEVLEALLLSDFSNAFMADDQQPDVLYCLF